MNFKINVFAVLAIFMLIAINVSGQKARNYYLSTSGQNKGDGSLLAPWKTLEKISSVTLHPGDTVFFKSGDRFDGHFVIKGSGTVSKKIVITAYGNGPKPIITGQVGQKGGGDYQEAILIENADNLLFDGLEVHNERMVSRPKVKDTDAFGILVNNTKGVMENLTFQNMTIRDVFAAQPMLDKNSFDAIQVSGISFRSSKNTSNDALKQIKNIEIKNSYFANLQRLGIQLKHGRGAEGVGNDSLNRIMNVHIHDNVFYYNGGSGVLPNGTYNCLIENNIFISR